MKKKWIKWIIVVSLLVVVEHWIFYTISYFDGAFANTFWFKFCVFITILSTLLTGLFSINWEYNLWS